MKYNLLVLASVALLASCKDDTEPTPPPTADFTAPESTEQTVAVSFQNKSKNAQRYVWDFGDGSTGQEDNPTHTYTTDGVYSVKLKAFGTEKNDSITKTIKIEPYNIFAHTNLPFAGTYACKVVDVYSVYQSPAIRTRLPDQDVVITKDGVNTMRWNNLVLSYLPSDRNSPQTPFNSRYQFYNANTSSSPRVITYASFYTSGDSASFSVAKTVGASNSGTTTFYYGKRRP
ncbi:PKD domain-containing protein [Hymenobacter sp. GOD-10R]|uniref:PKD domain-containing protein n=1 Tax=Hymenobacter sp. GOD-10R TaxID=3093922 RepID=UPI002D789AF6|nr:PKD domain-containing protein [Hymenobacter sp. GOD-10R]WRQ27234.1 PKD domain-containing protein [Hymenobacter sp. GOD-10R]